MRKRFSISKLFLNILVLVCIAVPVWVAYQIFISHTLSLASSGVILAVDIGVLIWNISVLRHYRYSAPSFWLTTFVILGCLISLSFLGVEPLASMRKEAVGVVEQKTQSGTLLHPSEIAIVEDIRISPPVLGIYGRTLYVELKPVNAKANTEYAVELYEKGRFRARNIVGWNQPEINVNATKTIYFKATSDEVDAYWGASLRDRN